MTRTVSGWMTLALLWASASRLGAQGADSTLVGRCDGRTVTRIQITANRPPFEGTAARWRILARRIGLHHATTQPHVVQAFMALHLGEPCTEFRRAESERVLRALPFLADAKVRLVADTGGGVAALVETTDEVSALAGGRFRGITPDELSLGTANVAGLGLRTELTWERSRNYRTGYGGRLVSYAAFDRPYVVSVDAYRHRIGHDAALQLEHPFFTNLQRVAWHAGVRSSTIYPHVERPARDPLALELAEQRWDVGGVVRVFGTRTAALVGGALTGRRVTPGGAGVIVSDTGFAGDTGVALRGRYLPFKATRAGLIFGARQMRYVEVRGFDALTGTQNVESGVSGAIYVAHGFQGMGESDFFLSGATYGGLARPGFLLANLVEVEGRRDNVTPGWNSIVGSTRTALYLGEAPGFVLIVSDELSGGMWSRLPLQLTLGDLRGGIRGYRSSGIAGERRNVARGELRRSWMAAVRQADVGVAAFGEVGTLMAGDAPYGWTGSRYTVGLSLLGAYPTRSKRLYRADLAIPLTRSGEGPGRIELRFSSEDRTTRFWEEPQDVARARTGEVPSQLFAWPTR